MQIEDTALLDAIFRRTSDAVLVVSQDGRIHQANAAAAGLFSRAEDSFSDVAIGEVFSEPMAARFTGGMRDALANEQPVSAEDELVLANGTKRLLLVLQVPYLEKEAKGERGVVAIARDITDRRRREDALRKYLDAMVKARDEERRQISRELHDEAGQVLTSMLVRLRAMERDARIGDDATLRAKLTDIVRVGETLHGELSRLGRGLHPGVLENLGLEAALSHLAAEARKTGLRVDTDLRAGPRLPLAIELAAYRIVQESTNNVIKHAKAKSVAIMADWSERKQLRLSIADDGIGLARSSTSDSGIGLLGIRERVRHLGGDFSIASNDKGTKIELTIPIGSLAP
jgi:PAS domain S-box-containing protein